MKRLVIAALVFAAGAAFAGPQPATRAGASKAAVARQAGDPQAEALLRTLKRLYPATTFTQVSRTAVPAIFEVQMGRNLAYTDDSGRHFFFGALYDMQAREDLTAARRAALGIEQPVVAGKTERQADAPRAVNWNDLPFADAFKRVKGNGERKLAIFSDPDCPYCKQLERQLEKLENVTIYTFLYPIESLHPDAADKAESIWCAGDDAARNQAWYDLMVKGIVPASGKPCANPIERNVNLAAALGVRGTPTLFSADGRRLPGMAPADRIEQFLAGGQ
ncbi:DsbC family protein [Rubrivivax gelatinosus]|uniref:DsbC family protein n=1 Tax=Rubrivivax gelatinosus TaxID=28068 RepID=UPI0002F0503C|nr:DsbC family protein [Rubrivivax gelatinosus]MBG6083028.1 thiol:disulfide interchange protein DsbC [Rubrivivax gelatinosus]